jgi:starvation-inducible DNA-binding protein
LAPGNHWEPLGAKHAVFSLHHTGSSLPATELGPHFFPLSFARPRTKSELSIRAARLRHPSIRRPDLPDDAVRALSAKLNEILADAFALYLKTKNFHWHMSGPHFRDYHLLLDEQSEQILGTTDDIAERVRNIGGTTLRSIGHISKLQNVQDNDETFVPAHEMLRELMADNKMVAASMRECHELAEKHEDAATAGLLENFIDGTERRTWFLFEASRAAQK